MAAFDRANGQVNFRGVWQTLPRNGEFVERCLIIALTVVVIKSEREMRFGQIRLQSNRCLCRGARFSLARGSWIKVVINPIFNPRQSGKRTRKVWVEFRSLFKKLLRLFGITAESVRPVTHLVPLHKG